MAEDGRAVESRELRAIWPDWRANCGPYQYRADGRCGDKQSTHHHCERRLLAERHGASADNGNFLKGPWPLRTRHPLALADGSNPQDDAHACATTRGAGARDAAEGAPAGWRGRGHYHL